MNRINTSKSTRDFDKKPPIKQQIKLLSDEVKIFGKTKSEIEMGQILNSCRVLPTYFDESHHKFLKSMTNTGQNSVNSRSENKILPIQASSERDSLTSYRSSARNILSSNSNTEALQKIRKTLRTKTKSTTENSKIIEKHGQKIVSMFLKCARNFPENNEINNSDHFCNEIDKQKIISEPVDQPPKTKNHRFYKLLKLRPQRCADEFIIQNAIQFKLKKNKAEIKQSYNSALDYHSKRDTETYWPIPLDKSKEPKINTNIHSSKLKLKCVRLLEEKPIVRLDRIAKLDIFLKKSRKKIPTKEICMKNVEERLFVLTEHKDQFKYKTMSSYKYFVGLNKDMINIGINSIMHTKFDTNLYKDFRNRRKLPEAKFMDYNDMNFPDSSMFIEPIKETAEYYNASPINTCSFYGDFNDSSLRGNHTTLASHFLKVQNAKIDESFSSAKRKPEISGLHYSPDIDYGSPQKFTTRQFSPNILSVINNKEYLNDQYSALDDNECINEIFFFNNDDRCSISKIENINFNVSTTSLLNSNRTSYNNNGNVNNFSQKSILKIQPRVVQSKNNLSYQNKTLAYINNDLTEEDQLKLDPLKNEEHLKFHPEFFKFIKSNTKYDTNNEKIQKASEMKPPKGKTNREIGSKNYTKANKNKEHPDNHRDPSFYDANNLQSEINTDNNSYQSSQQSNFKTTYNYLRRFNSDQHVNFQEKLYLDDLTEKSIIRERSPKIGLHSLDNTGIFKVNDSRDNFSLRLLSDSRTRVSNEELSSIKKIHQNKRNTYSEVVKASKTNPKKYSRILLNANMMRVGKEERLNQIQNELEELNQEIEKDQKDQASDKNKDVNDIDNQNTVETNCDQKEEEKITNGIELIETINNCKKDIAHQMAKLTNQKDTNSLQG